MKTFIIYFTLFVLPEKYQIIFSTSFSISHEDVSESLGIQCAPNCPLRPHPDLVLPSPLPQWRAPPSTQLLASERQSHPGFRPPPQSSRTPSASHVVSAFTVSHNPSFSSPASFLARGGFLAGVPEPPLAPPVNSQIIARMASSKSNGITQQEAVKILFHNGMSLYIYMK